jgi:hypothetical protein
MKAAAYHGEEATGEGTTKTDIHEPAAGEGMVGSAIHVMEEEPTLPERKVVTAPVRKEGKEGEGG